jgi:hypothetical protein
VDRQEIDLAAYRGLREPYLDWTYVAGRCRELARAIVKQELTTTLPLASDAGLDEAAP